MAKEFRRRAFTRGVSNTSLLAVNVGAKISLPGRQAPTPETAVFGRRQAPPLQVVAEAEFAGSVGMVGVNGGGGELRRGGLVRRLNCGRADGECGLTIGKQPKDGAEDNDNAAEPNPFDERVQVRVDDGIEIIWIPARIDDVEIFAERG